MEGGTPQNLEKPSEKVRDKLNSTHKTDSQTNNVYLNR